MSSNIAQVYTANPATTNLDLDLLYIGRSPYGPTDDAAIRYADFKEQFVLKAAAFTTGSVLFADASGEADQDNSEFFWDVANKRLGLGNNTPEVRLDLEGKINLYDTSKNVNAGVSTSNSAEVIAIGVNDGAFNTFGGAYDSSKSGVRLSMNNQGGNIGFAFFTRLAGVSSTDTNRALISLDGNFLLSGTGVATTATAGFPYIPSCAGVPTGVPASYTDMIPMVYDRSGDDLYLYSSGWKQIPTSGGAFTPGSIIFSGAGGELTQANANLFYDNAGKKLGINTQLPVRDVDLGGILGLFDGGSRLINSGVASEINGGLINIGSNDSNINRFGGTYDIAQQGGFFRIDSRAGQSIFQWHAREAGSAFLNIISSLDVDGLFTSTKVRASTILISGFHVHAQGFGGVNGQGAYLVWNRAGNSGASAFINQQGFGGGGWEWAAYNNSNILTGVPMTLTQGGSLSITGNLSKGSGTFTIDHPLDPENKILQHSFVESPDMMNVYNGNVVLDARGETVVEMPSYFEALNMDFRYQLSCIGAHAPIYISQEIANNKFSIAGGTAGLKVSWQVTGVRNDKFAQDNRVQVEIDKELDKKGSYIHPQCFGVEPEENERRKG
jgi:hypothetical protein